MFYYHRGFRSGYTQGLAQGREEAEEDWLARWPRGTMVTKKSGASWTGRIVGYYSTSLTPIGYAVESINEPGSVQIYPAAALILI